MGGVDPDGLVRVPVMVVSVPAGGVAGFAEAVTATMAGCRPYMAVNLIKSKCLAFAMATKHATAGFIMTHGKRRCV